MNVYLDIETIPTQRDDLRAEFAAAVKPPANYKKPDTIAEWMHDNRDIEVAEAIAKTSFDGAYGHILCIGVAFDDQAPEVFCSATSAADAPSSEPLMLRAFIDWFKAKVDQYDRPLFIGHNLIEFDLRFLFQRSIVCGIAPSAYIPFDKRPWDDGVYDTMVKWAGTKNRVGLDKLAKALGLQGKGGIDGSMVWPMVQEGRIKEVCDYCAADVALTREVYKRMTFQA